MSGDVGADIAAVLTEHRAIVSGTGHGWAVICACGYREMGTDTTIHLADALEPLIAARVEAAKAEGRAEALRELPPEPDNHHNATACPYCTPALDPGPRA